MHGPTGTTPGELAARSLSLWVHMCLPCITGVLEPDQKSQSSATIEVVFASRSMVLLTGRSRVFIHFLMRRVHHAPQMAVGATEAICPTVLDSIMRRCMALSPVSSLFEWHHFFDRSVLFHKQLCRHRDIVTAKQIIDGKANHRIYLLFYSFRRAR